MQIHNRSPLILNGVALAGARAGRPEVGRPPAASSPASASGPGKVSLHRQTSAETVERLGLKKGVHVLAADLSGL